ncbi:MAG: chemotaxis protein CheW [Spirochaetes bacterium]|jgi:two-component system chemotaxis sensor kinase CheA|nr:chemotaxis protein CheW [Spirochaetota bacterium]
MAYSLGEYQDIFLEEADDQLQELNKNLLELEQAPDDEDTINNIFRAAHSLKSSAGFVGLMDLSELAHKMENLLQGVRDKTMHITPEMVDLLFKCFDHINLVIGKVSQGEEPIVDLSGIIAEIGDMQGQSSSMSEAKEKQTDEPAESDRASVPKTTFSGQEKRHLKRGVDEGLSCYELTIFIEPDAPMKWVKAQLILNNIKNMAQVVKTIPDEENLTDEAIRDVLKLIILTDEDLRDVRSACDVDLVSQIDVLKISMEKRENKYVIKFGDKQVLSETKEDEPVAEHPAAFLPQQPVEKVEYTEEDDSEFDSEDERMFSSGTQQSAGSTERRTASVSRNAPILRTVKVSVDKLDDLLNNVGELVIANSGFFRLYEDLKKMQLGKNVTNEFKNRIEQMARIAKDLQSGIMKTRMVPIGQVFTRFHRLIRDVSKECGKSVQLVTRGEDTELDKKVIDVIGEPLMHMIRNSIDHGIETPEERKALKKSDVATVTLSAHQGGNQIFVEVIDDGRGLDVEVIRNKAVEKGLVTSDQVGNLDHTEIYNFIFHPGFSTAKTVTDVSGRGVGMNVVREVVQEMGGNITIESEQGMGTRFIMAFPLTLAIIPAIMVSVKDETYAIPLTDVIETINISHKDITTIEGHEVINLRGEILSLVRLSQFVGVPLNFQNEDDIPVIVVGYSSRKIGLIVDALEGKLEIVIKSLETNFRTVEGLAGASILGDGSIALILDIASMINKVINEQEKMSPEEKLALIKKQEDDYHNMKALELDSDSDVVAEKSEFSLPVQDESGETGGRYDRASKLPDEEAYRSDITTSLLKETTETKADKQIEPLVSLDSGNRDGVLPGSEKPVFDITTNEDDKISSDVVSQDSVEPTAEIDKAESNEEASGTSEIDQSTEEDSAVTAEDITSSLEAVDIYKDETQPVTGHQLDDADEKVKEALKSFKSELNSNVKSTVSMGDPDEHIKRQLALNENDLAKIKLLANVGITQAAESLSKIISKRVDMAIPDVRLVPAEKIMESGEYAKDRYVSVYMPLIGDISGTVIFNLPEASAFSLVDDLYSIETDKTMELNEDGISALKEITNITGSSVINAFSERTGLSILSQVPSLVHDELEKAIKIIADEQYDVEKDYALTMDTEFYYEDDRIVGHLMILPDVKSLRILVDNLRDNG